MGEVTRYKLINGELDSHGLNDEQAKVVAALVSEAYRKGLSEGEQRAGRFVASVLKPMFGLDRMQDAAPGADKIRVGLISLARNITRRH